MSCGKRCGVATPRKKWPHAVEWCRCDCIALTRQGRRALVEALDYTDDPMMLRGLAKAIDAFREIENKLLAVGPRGETEP